MLTSVGEGLFAVRHGGPEADVIALHGWGRSGRDFAPVLAGLDALAVDLPGFGASEPPPHACGAQWYADRLVDLARAYPGAVWVGHSFGGRVAACLAADHPELVGGIAFTGVPLVRVGALTRPPFGYRLIRWLAGHRLVPASVLERARRRRGSADYNAATGVMRDVLVTSVNEDYGDQLARIAAVGVPTRLIWGQHDSDVGLDVAREATRRLGGAPLTIVDGSGHLIDDGLAQELRAAIEDLRKGTA